MLLSRRLSCHAGGTDCMHSSLEAFGSLFTRVVQVFDLASCLKHTVTRGACIWLHRAPRFESYKYVVTLTRSREDEHYVYNVTLDNDGDGRYQQI